MYSAAVRRTTGWELVFDAEGNVRESDSISTLINELKTKYPPAKIKIFEVLIVAEDYSVSGGSQSTSGVARSNMLKKVGV